VIAYLMAGFPKIEDTGAVLLAAQRAGAALVELGLPFSDPLADGPAVQAAGQRALAGGMTTALALQQVHRARADGLTLPLVVMTYLNPILQMGLADFCATAAVVGVDGLLVPDLPVDEAGELSQLAGGSGLAFNTMVAPTTPDRRLSAAARLSTGFLYCVSRTGVTGAGPADQSEGRELLRRARSLTAVPLVLGFGVRRVEQVRELSGLADAVAVGSALLEATESALDPAAAVASALEGLQAA
jgi:tryptophan synthase alpha chain